MSLGTLGSTLNDELNRLANGGTYRDMDDMVDEALAAKQWANRENISPYSTDTVGVLNEIAGLGLDKKNWLDFNGVCNYIAGTSGLPAAAALRQIYPTTDLLTGVASFYTDAADALTGGYVFLPGITGNYAFAPDSSALDITGDLDLRVYCAPDTWTPAADTGLINKYGYSDNNRSYSLGWHTVADYSKLTFRISTAGTTANFTATASENVPFLAGQSGWARATYQRDTGSGQCEVKFYYSTNGTTWTQLGTAFTAASPAATFNSTAPLLIGGIGNTTTNVSPFAGKIYRAQVLSGVNGITAFDANFATGMTSQSVTSFTESSTNAATVTITRTTAAIQPNVLTNLGNAGALLPTTVGSSLAADSNDAKFLDHTGTNYVYLPGVAGNNLVTPDAASLDITGDLDLRAYVALDDWTPSSGPTFISKDASSGTQTSFTWQMLSNGRLYFTWSPNGTSQTSITSTVAPTISDGSPLWIRVTFDVDNGASGNDVKFWTSNDGTTWTQLGTTVTTAGVASIFSGTGQVTLGSTANTGAALTGKIYRAQILNGIDGTTVLDVDTSVITTGAATSFTAVTGQTVTINRSTSGRKTVAVTQPTWLFGTDDYMEVNNRYMAHSTSDENYVYLSGSNGNYMSVADTPPLDITGDLDLQVKVALDDWTPAANSALLYKWDNAGSSAAYGLRVNATTGRLILLWTENGSTVKSATSTVSPTVTDGATLWVRSTLDVDNGASGNDVKFFTSSDGTTWTQLGTTVTTAGVTNIFSGTGQVEIGGFAGGLSPSKGKFFRAIIKNGIDGTTVLDANAAVITLPSQTTFVDSSSNAYTVTINKSGVGTFVSTGNYMYLPGVASNYASAPDSAALDITGDIDLRVKVAMDDWTPSAEQSLIGKRVVSGSQQSYWLSIYTDGKLVFSWSTNGSTAITTQTSTVATGIADGATKWVRATMDVDNGASGYDIKYYLSDNGTTWTQLGTTVTGVGTTSIFSGTAALEVGSVASGANQARGKFFRAQVLNGIGGTVAFDANFESSITSLLQTSFTESSTNAATVTINRSGSTYRSAGVIDAGYLYPGATNTFSNSTTNFLDFAASQSFTLFAMVRSWAGGTGFRNILSKNAPATAIRPGYSIYTNNNSIIFGGVISDSAARTFSNPLTIVSGENTNLNLIRNTSADNLILSGLTPTTDTTTASLASPDNSFFVGGNNDMELYAVAVFRQALTATQIRQITNYFANREAYL
jgi:hypothetical protein